MDYSITYEDGFLKREIASIAHKADVAITELIANAHDAGASEVKIKYTGKEKELITVEDNGIGLTENEFMQRWLKLRYDRKKHQGPFVKFPNDNNVTTKRRAFGRNGVGRHAGLCFDDEYEVETWRDGICNSYKLRTASGKQPIKLLSYQSKKKSGHGTKVKVIGNRHLIALEELTNIISARFLFNPEFKVFINEKQITLSKHPGVIKTEVIQPVGNITIKLTLIDSALGSRTSRQHGIAFWLGGRLLGEPSWFLGNQQIIDGRKSFAKRYTVIAESEDLFDFIEPDWSGFKSDFTAIETIADQVANFVKSCYAEFHQTDIDTAKRQVFNSHKSDLKGLSQLAHKELADFINQILEANPDIKVDVLELAFKAALNLEKSRAGVSLLHKLNEISPDDTESLNSFLEEWSISDAMTVLAEVDSRIKVIEAIDRLSGDHTVDELHTLHPLIERARWVFGPEFDTPEYVSNKGLVKVMQTVLKTASREYEFINAAKRPDIVVRESSSFSALGLEEFDGEIRKVKKVLLIELKKGGFEIGRSEMDQARHYVEDIWHGGVGSSSPYIKAFVVGDRVSKLTGRYQEIGASKERPFGEVAAITFSELVRSAEARLFSLRERIEERYNKVEVDPLLAETLKEPEQGALKLP